MDLSSYRYDIGGSGTGVTYAPRAAVPWLLTVLRPRRCRRRWR
ncbi:hypothetical protein [Streptomyces olivaceoviridis]